MRMLTRTQASMPPAYDWPGVSGSHCICTLGGTVWLNESSSRCGLAHAVAVISPQASAARKCFIGVMDC